MKKSLFLILIITFLVIGCSSSDDANVTDGNKDNFDRKALLINVADNIVIPAYQNFSEDMTALKTATSNFTTTTNEANLVILRNVWIEAYISWQSVGMFEIGKAEEISFRNFMNVYPVTTSDLESNIATGEYDLTTVTKQDEQGFAALDYLLNGLSDTDAGIVEFYSTNTNAAGYKKYITDLVNRMDNLANQVLTNWKEGYRDTFVNNSGASATSSLDKLVNDFIFHYEKHLRAAKIGIPAGIFSETFDNKVEAFYKGDISKKLFNANLSALQDFFNGKHFAGDSKGESLKTYLDFLNTIRNGEDLSSLINNQFNTARAMASGLNDDFSFQIRTDNSLMTKTYDELQKNVVYLKVDMLQAISVSVDFVDADGD
ncbi:imelysin family protein [Aquimarina muelleri]|uniref:Iron-regulated protein A n=1 Tax=Aquimarina muelleri TaxID=279356 RepID=A0A918JU03_9FLAO|nr:imelysin family protein [Aquimarina muelleri]MCX2761953.1 imelysin family protein [Aquimarina muelleri]GGX10630.1 iron-regulated protein A precursor [Aquimarina muelleri]